MGGPLAALVARNSPPPLPPAPPPPRSIQVLGLQLDNYVTDARPLKGNDWQAMAQAGGLRGAAKMRSLFAQYVMEPLLSSAEELVAAEAEDAVHAAELAGVAAADAAAAARRYVAGQALTVAVVVAAAVVVAVVVARRRGGGGGAGVRR
jgi:hypothetical protein